MMVRMQCVLLCWLINGLLRCVSVEDGQVVCSLDNQLNRFFNLGFRENHAFAEGKCLLVENRWLLRMTEKGAVFCDGHYEVNRPSVSVPDSQALAI